MYKFQANWAGIQLQELELPLHVNVVLPPLLVAYPLFVYPVPHSTIQLDELHVLVEKLPVPEAGVGHETQRAYHVPVFTNFFDCVTPDDVNLPSADMYWVPPLLLDVLQYPLNT